MLSPGKWHETVPRELKANLRHRLKVLRAAEKDKALQKDLRDICARDILFFVNCFVVQFNPNAIGDGSLEVGPFITWPFQEVVIADLLACMNPKTRHDVVIEKSREMGISWICLLVITWAFLFHPMKKFLMISRSEEAVDNGPDDSDSLFWKIDFVLEHLPGWMTQNAIRRRKLGFKNTRNGSVITGKATTKKTGVGGRAAGIFIDEFSQIEADQAILSRTSDTSGARIFNGTHVGMGTAFFELTQRVDWKKIVLHWTQHPDKRRGLYRYDDVKGQIEVLDKDYEYPPDFKFVMDVRPLGGPFPGLRSPWYDAQCSRKGSERAVAEDLDINPTGSAAQFFDAYLIRQIEDQYGADPVWKGYLHYDRDTGSLIAGHPPLVPSPGGELSLWINPLVNGRVANGWFGIGADVARGEGATPSCISIINAVTGDKVGEYTNAHIKPDEFAVLLVALCWLFSSPDGEGARLCWEMAGPGMETGSRIMELGYRNVYYRSNDFQLGSVQSDKPGWYPRTDAKRFLLEEYQVALRSRQIKNPSVGALRECLAFVFGGKGEVYHPGEKNENDPGRSGVNHGDHVIADALAWKMVKEIGKLSTGKSKPQEEEIRYGSLAWRRRYRDNLKRDAELWLPD